jgi:hypothetical protein
VAQGLGNHAKHFIPHLDKNTIMKKLLLAAFALLLCAKVFAQNANVVLYTENGERFHAILNGLRMNDEPVTNLKVQDLNQPGYALKVIFENKTLGEMDKNMMVEAGNEAVYAIRLDKKGAYKLVYRSSVPLAQAPAPAPQQHVVVWGAPVQTGVVTTTGTTGTVGTSTTITEQTTMTTTTTGTGMNTNVNSGTGENVNMNVTTDGFGLNISVSGTGTGTTTSGSTGVVGSSTTVTTTTTTTTSGDMGGGVVYTEPVYAAPCTEMYRSDFDKAKESIRAKSFEDSKMTLAKQITSKNCLSASQVKDIMQLFDFEASKLEYAKYAYDYCWEKNNYYQVNDAFDFESSISELDAYISTR